jgi:hypothetical protein
MGKRKGELLSFAALVFVFMLTTLFFFMVYNLHYDSASDDFTGFTIFDYQSEPGMQAISGLGTLREDLVNWAEENNAIIFYKGFSAAGIAAVDYSDWFEKTLHVPFDGTEAKTAIVTKNNGNLSPYIEGDVLFPRAYNYQIVGEFESNNVPTFQGDAFFYFPLSDITDMQGMLFTDVTNENALGKLTDIVEKTGRSVQFQTYSDSGSNIFDVTKKMFLDDFVSRSMLFAFLGLVFCAVFAVSMMYRESNRHMTVHHLYGATYLSMFVKLLLRLVGIAILGTIFGYFLGRTQLYLIHRAAYLNVAVFAGIFNAIFVCVIQTISFFSWKQKYSGKEGRY